MAAGRHVCFSLFRYIRQGRLGRHEILACWDGIQYATDSSQRSKRTVAKPLPPERSFFSIDADNLVLTALKKADRDGTYRSAGLRNPR